AELRRHINLSAVHDLLPVRTRRRLTRVINAVTAALMLGVTYIGVRYVRHIYSSGDVTSVLEIPMYLPLLVLPVGFFLPALRYLSALRAGGQEAAAAPEESAESALAQEQTDGLARPGFGAGHPAPRLSDHDLAGPRGPRAERCLPSG